MKESDLQTGKMATGTGDHFVKNFFFKVEKC